MFKIIKNPIVQIALVALIVVIAYPKVIRPLLAKMPLIGDWV